MDINIKWDEFRERRLFVATPMYGGQCSGQYTRSIMQLALKCSVNGMHMQTQFLFNESLITRARNYLADEFLRSDCTHLLYIDSDIGFDADDALTLLALQDANPDNDEYDVITAAYPKKCISWEKIKTAVDKGVADEDPNELEKYVGDYVFNPIPVNGMISYQLDKPVEISEAGTGFMLIRRNTFEKYDVAFPEQAYLPDHARSDHFDGEREIMAYFDCIIEEGTRRYLSEDYMFCHNVRKAGMKVWLCPWMSLTHYGTYAFGGSLVHLAGVGADPTAGGVTEAKAKRKSKR